MDRPEPERATWQYTRPWQRLLALKVPIAIVRRAERFASEGTPEAREASA